MRYKRFGNTGLSVSEMGMGCSRLIGTLGKNSEPEAAGLLAKAYDSGINFYDTADSYGQGESERLLGKTFKGKRDRVVFAGKAGYCLSLAGGAVAKLKPMLRPLLQLLNPPKSSLLQARSAVVRQNFSVDYLRAAIEGSLKRLETDYLDLFQLHEPPIDALRDNGLLDLLEKLKIEGKIRYYGISCSSLEEALYCVKQPGISAIQLEINLLHQGALFELLPLAQQNQKAIVARQPFASGLLTSPADKKRPDQSGHTEPSSKVESFRSLAKATSRSLDQLALQFVLQLEGVSVVIPGMSKQKSLDANLGVLDMPLLTVAHLRSIGAIDIGFVQTPRQQELK